MWAGNIESWRTDLVPLYGVPSQIPEDPVSVRAAGQEALVL